MSVTHIPEARDQWRPVACPTPVGSVSAMSVSSHNPTTCKYCGDDYEPPTSARGYCSERCFTRQRGQGVLDRLDSDHRICSTCFRPIKSVETAPEISARTDKPVPECVIGFQDPTQHTTVAIDDFSDQPYQRLERTRWGCVCGTVSPHDRHEFIQQLDRTETVMAFFDALRDLADREAIDHAPDPRRFEDAFCEAGPDWAYIAGRSVYG